MICRPDVGLLYRWKFLPIKFFLFLSVSIYFCSLSRLPYSLEALEKMEQLVLLIKILVAVNTTIYDIPECLRKEIIHQIHFSIVCYSHGSE